MLVMSSTFIERSACNGPGSPMTPVADGAAPCRPLEDARLVRQGAVHLPGVAFDPIVPQQPVTVVLPDRGADHQDRRAVRFGAHDAVVTARQAPACRDPARPIGKASGQVRGGQYEEAPVFE